MTTTTGTPMLSTSVTTTTGTTGSLMLSTSCTVLGGDENRLEIGFSYWVCLNIVEGSTIVQTNTILKHQNQAHHSSGETLREVKEA